MRKDFTFLIVFCAVMVALTYVLDLVAIKIGPTVKLTFYGLPLMVVGLKYKFFWGLMTGVVAGIIIQLLSPYGLSLASPFYALAPIFWGGLSGLFSTMLENQTLGLKVGIIVVICSISANFVNTFAFYMDSLLIKDSYYTTAAIIEKWPPRLLNMFIMFIPYMACLYAVSIALDRFVAEKEDE